MDGASEMSSVVDERVCPTADIQRSNQLQEPKVALTERTLFFWDPAPKLFDVCDWQEANFRQKTSHSNYQE